MTNNVREKTGALIPKLNFSLPVSSLRPVLQYVQGAEYAVLSGLERVDEQVHRVWRLQVSQAELPPQISRFLKFSAQLPAVSKL